MSDIELTALSKQPSLPMSRRSTVLAGLALPLASHTGVAGKVPSASADVVAALVARANQANIAFIAGDMTAWYRLAGPIAGDFTLMQPFGGPASHGFDGSPERLAAMARIFTGGRAELQLTASYVSDDLVVLVFVERQRALVGGLPEQDWSLRVTQVYRRSADTWELVHRHADPIVAWIGLEKAAALARNA